MAIEHVAPGVTLPQMPQRFLPACEIVVLETVYFVRGVFCFLPTSEIIDFETLHLARATRAKLCEILTSEI